MIHNNDIETEHAFARLCQDRSLSDVLVTTSDSAVIHCKGELFTPPQVSDLTLLAKESCQLLARNSAASQPPAHPNNIRVSVIVNNLNISLTPINDTLFTIASKLPRQN
ncbi:hypothetical protein AYI69_g10165 [Smittium culicis]|uniref:Late endosomal/lysosomal adaptor and MAPK and MTOR activator 5 n=1 Tax=Smittium culicis TaxID=133412 RepID=A0A1R1X7K6_9FUNG|nr:hypothetical protein AYI69_g10165 [Smittium culicis]